MRIAAEDIEGLICPECKTEFILNTFPTEEGLII
jgi:hypothetical protein